jgi:hypothetical protein
LLGVFENISRRLQRWQPQQISAWRCVQILQLFRLQYSVVVSY